MKSKLVEKVLNLETKEEVDLYKLYYNPKTQIVYFPESMIALNFFNKDKKPSLDELENFAEEIMDSSSVDILFENEQSANIFLDKFEVDEKDKEKIAEGFFKTDRLIEKD